MKVLNPPTLDSVASSMLLIYKWLNMLKYVILELLYNRIKIFNISEICKSINSKSV